MVTLRESGSGVKPGDRFGRLTILGWQFRAILGNRGRRDNQFHVVCECDCGEIGVRRVARFREKGKRPCSCGCRKQPNEFEIIEGTVRIALTRGKIAVIDEADWPLASQYNWCAVMFTGGFWYAMSGSPIEGIPTFTYLHRLIMGATEEQLVDHKDGDGLNCRRSNMRLCTRAQNNMNKHNRRGLSKYKGVYMARHRWVAMVSVNGRCRYLATFDTEEEAARAYNAAAIEQYGEFANLNVFES